MAFHKSLCFLMAIFITFICSSHAYTFEVGGKDGWTTHPSENYNTWSGRLRFLINDTLHFKYDGGSDSVLVVNKDDYDGCNVNSPITKLDGGDSMFKLDRSGPFYFISGNKSNCDQGEKLIVVVLALRNRSPPPSTISPPSPSTNPPPPVVSPTLPPSAPTISPGGGSASSPSGGSASSPDGGGSGSPTGKAPGGGSASSPGGGGSGSPGNVPGGGGASSPGDGGGGSSPGDGGVSSPGGGGTSSPGGGSSSAATPPLSSSITASLVTMIVALWRFI